MGKPKLYPTTLNGSLHVADALRLAFDLLVCRDWDDPRDVKDYTETVKRVLEVRHVWALGGARIGIYLVLKALAPPDAAEVIVPGYTCVVVPNAVRFAGCKPVYADIRMSDLNVDPAAIEAAITPRTFAVVMQHTYGIPADVDAIRDICDRRKLHLIEDAAHALGASYRGKPVGTLGVAAAFSSVCNKMISTDRGGLLVTNNSSLAAKVEELYRLLPTRHRRAERLSCLRLIYLIVLYDPALPRYVRSFLGKVMVKIGSACSKTSSAEFPEFDEDRYRADEIEGRYQDDYAWRLSGMLCRVGKWQIKRLKEDVADRNRKAAFLAPLLAAHGGVVPVYDAATCCPAFMNFPFLVADRDRWIKAFEECGIRVNGYLRSPLHPPQTACVGLNGYVWGACPNAEKVSSQILNIPLGRTAPMSILSRLAGLNFEPDYNHSLEHRRPRWKDDDQTDGNSTHS